MKRTLVTLAALLLVAPLQAQVVYPPKPAPVLLGPYVGGLFGRSEAKKECIGIISGGARTCDSTDLTFGLFGGYRLHRYYGAEVAYNNLGKVTATSQGPGSASTQTVSANIWDVSGIGFLPLDENLSAFARLGIYRATLDTSERGVESQTNYGFTYAGGLQWDLNPRYGVRAMWQRYRNVGRGVYDNNYYDILGLSFLYRFQ